jgi:hypothetical protein
MNSIVPNHSQVLKNQVYLKHIITTSALLAKVGKVLLQFQSKGCKIFLKLELVRTGLLPSADEFSLLPSPIILGAESHRLFASDSRFRSGVALARVRAGQGTDGRSLGE